MMSPQDRTLCITAADGQTGSLIAELLLTHEQFSSQFSSIRALTLHPNSVKAKALEKLGAHIVPHKPGRLRDMVSTLRSSGADAICLIPPAHPEKVAITQELISAASKAGVPNVLFLSSAGADLAERNRQPRLREFVDLEAEVMAAKGEPSTTAGHSPCVLRAGFYAENLLLYAPQAQKEGVLPLPIGEKHKFAPVALGDIAQIAAHILTGKGPHGFDDRHRGQLMVVTGPKLVAGHELATAASKALGVEMMFEDISAAEAKRVLHQQSHADDSEKQYLLEYYSLVREGKTNYVATTAFHDVTGQHPQEPDKFFSVYANEFKPQRPLKKRKI